MSARILEVTEESWDALKRDNAALRAQVERLKNQMAREREKERRRQLRWVCAGEMRLGRNKHIRSALGHFSWASMERRFYASDHHAGRAAEHAKRLRWAAEERKAAHEAGQGVPR